MESTTEARIVDLTTERLVEPLGIATARPVFGWRVASSNPDHRQAAYELQVLAAPTEFWSTGIVQSGMHTDIEYAGPPLLSDRRYDWRVRTRTRDGTTAWATSWFETSLLSTSDWIGRWLVPTQEKTLREDYSVADVVNGFTGPATPPLQRLRPPLQIRQGFTLIEPPVRARLFASARGIYQAEINGQHVGDEVLAPGYDAYPHRLSFQCHDVTDLLIVGENIVGTTVADGWWAGRIGITGSSAPYGDELAVIWQLSLLFADGRRQIVGSGDNEARSRRGARDYADLFIGERYDARARTPGWARPGFDAGSWQPVAASSASRELLTPFAGEPIRRTQILPPVAVANVDDRTLLVDIGQVIAGRLRLVIGAPSGTVVTIEHTEVLAQDGSFFNNIAGPNKDQIDVFVSGGDAPEQFEPAFTFHGFRHARITATAPFTIHDVVAVVIGSDLRQTAELATSDPRIDRLHANVVWSQRANFLSVPTDCPQRERAGWTGDMQVFARAAATNMDVRAFVERWLANVRAEQYHDGAVPVVVPVIPSMIDEGSTRMMVAAGWSDAIVLVPWALYERYGDKRALADNYHAMRRWVDFQWTTARESLPERLANVALDERSTARHSMMWNTGPQFGDWLAPSTMDESWDPVAAVAPTINGEIIAAMFHARSTEHVAKVADVLGFSDDADALAHRASLIRTAFTEEYVSADGLLPVDLQGPYVLALAFRLIPENRRGRAVDRLKQLIQATGGHLDTGFLSTSYLLDVLWDAGEKDLARGLLWKETPPSWLYAVKQGATTVWESWEAIGPDGTPTMSSLNHYAFGCVDDWIFRRLAGITPLTPGYATIRIAPDVEGPLSYVKSRLDTVSGPITVHWSRDSGTVQLKIDIPLGMVAELEYRDHHEVMAAGRHVRTVELG